MEGGGDLNPRYMGRPLKDRGETKVFLIFVYKQVKTIYKKINKLIDLGIQE